MTLPEKGSLLRIFIGESDKHDGIPLYEWLVRKAKQEKLAGASVFRCIEGYGGHSLVHTAKILELSTDLPVVVEIIDTIDKINTFMTVVDDVIKDGLATLEDVQIRLYRSQS